MLCFAPISMNRSMGNGYTTTLLLEILAQRNFVADFIRLKLNFIQKQKKSLFESSFGGLRGNVRTRGRLPIHHN